MAFLIIDNDQNFADTLAANLLKEFGGEVHIKENASEAIALLELLDDFQFIINTHSSKDENIADKLLKFLQSASKEVAKKLDSEQQFQKAIKEIAKSKNLGIKQLNSKMIALISYFITKGSELDTTQIRSNIVMASILHDSKLSNEYAGIRSIGELQAQYLPDKDNILIDKHATLAAEHLDKFPSISSEVVKIVRHHHGSNEGKGFSTDLSLIKSIQSLVFILAEEISFAIIKRERVSINLGEILDGISRKYDHHEKLDELMEQFKENL